MRRLLAAAALVPIAACGQPAAPSDVPNLGGTWRSEYTLVACSHHGACSPKTCFDASTAVLLLEYRVELVVRQDRADAGGTVRLTSRSKMSGAGWRTGSLRLAERWQPQAN